jgi:hypothetical protein
MIVGAVGLLMMLGGMLYAVGDSGKDTSVEGVNGRTHNLGLIADRHDSVTVSATTAIVGAILFMACFLAQTLNAVYDLQQKMLSQAGEQRHAILAMLEGMAERIQPEKTAQRVKHEAPMAMPPLPAAKKLKSEADDPQVDAYLQRLR